MSPWNLIVFQEKDYKESALHHYFVTMGGIKEGVSLVLDAEVPLLTSYEEVGRMLS